MRRFFGLSLCSLSFVFLVTLAIGRNSISEALQLQAPTPGPGAMTIYSVTNPSSSAILVTHIITDRISTYTVFTSTIPSDTTSEFHLRDMAEIPIPFTGAMTLESDMPFSSVIVGYDYPSIPVTTPTNAPTATATSTGTAIATQTATPSSTPTSSATSTLPVTATFQISSSVDDVNQAGTNLSTDSVNMWFGGCGSSSCYTGLRFVVNIPQGAAISSAHVNLYSSQNQWIPVQANIYAEQSGNSVPFSGSSMPSQRMLTQHYVYYNENISWNANTWYSLADISTVIQEVTSRPDWQAGNSLSVIIQGTAPGSWGRDFISSFDGNSSHAPQLVVEYGDSLATPTPSSTATATNTPPQTVTPIITSTATATASATRTPTPTVTPTTGPTKTPTPTPTSRKKRR